MIFQSDTIQITTAKANNTCSFFYKNQPELTELGYLIFGIDSTLPAHWQQKIQQLFNNLSDNYFLRQDIADPLGCFEKVLNEFNLEFTVIFKEQNIWSKKINLTVGLIFDQQLHFANYGSNHLLLLRQKNYVDVVKQVSANLYIPGKKFFDQIYSGPIDKFSRIALVNQAVFDYLSTDNIKNIFNLLPIQNIASQIEQLINNQLINQNLSGLVLTNPVIDTIKNDIDNKKINLSANDTIKSLEVKSAETQKYLHPKYLPDFSGWTNKIKNIYSPNKKKLVYNNDNQKVSYFNNYVKKFKDLPSDIVNINRKIKHKKENVFSILKNLPNNFIFSLKQFQTKIKLLSGLSKFLLAIALVLILALLVNLSIMGFSKNTQISTEYYDETVVKINNLHSEAQASIIYGDNQKARKLLGEALNTIYSLPKNNTDRETINQQLLDKNNELMSEANKLVNLNNLTTLINVANITSENLVNGGLDIIENNLFILTNKSLFRLNLTNRDIAATNLPESSPLYLIPEQNNLLVYFNNNTIYQYTVTDNQWEQINFNWNATNPPVTAASYNNNLYLVSGENNHIVRYNRSNNNYLSGQVWLGDNDFGRITKLAIDGAIYTWHDQGQLNKFIRGQKQEFSVETIDPMIRTVNQLLTKNDLPALYLLDNDNKRIVILNKDGKLVKQYQADQLKQITGLAVSQTKENNKRLIYLIDQNNIYELLVEE